MSDRHWGGEYLYMRCVHSLCTWHCVLWENPMITDKGVLFVIAVLQYVWKTSQSRRPGSDVPTHETVMFCSLCVNMWWLFLFLWAYVITYRLAMEVERPSGVGVSSHTWSSFWTWLERPLSFFSDGFPLFFCVCEIYSAPTHWQCHNAVRAMMEIKDLSLSLSLYLCLSFCASSPSLYIPLADNGQIIRWVDLEMEMALLKLCKKGFGFMLYR